jgi:uncharacterized membrane protein
MKGVLRFMRATLAGGLLFLVPIVVLTAILGRAFEFARKLVAPLANLIPAETVLGVGLAKLLAIGFVVFICFLAGVIARSSLARKLVAWLELAILSNLPGYEFLKGMGEGALGAERSSAQQVVLANFEEAWAIGFLIERLDNGFVAVFIPDVPNPRSGAVHLMTSDRVQVVDVPPLAVLKCLKRLGTGSNALFGKLAIAGKSDKTP